MSSQLQDYFEEAVETVARTLYTRNRIPRELAWEDTDPEIRRGRIRDARTVIDLWLTVTQKCLYCRGTGRAADGHPCDVCKGVTMSEFRVVDGNGDPYPPLAQPCRTLRAAMRRRDFYNTVTSVSGEARMPVKPLRIERRSQVVSMWEPWNVGAQAARDTNPRKDDDDA